MTRRIIGCFVTLAISVLVSPFVADAQPPARSARVGVVNPGTAASEIEAFRQGLRALGYIEGHNIGIEYRSAEGKTERQTV
jgi:putative tryptophan/tyrosine transport system substrate-binding protein